VQRSVIWVGRGIHRPLRVSRRTLVTFRSPMPLMTLRTPILMNSTTGHRRPRCGTPTAASCSAGCVSGRTRRGPISTCRGN